MKTGEFENYTSWIFFVVGFAICASVSLPKPDIFWSAVGAGIVLLSFAFSAIEGYLTDWKGWAKYAKEQEQ
jgi:hypothetical protein